MKYDRLGDAFYEIGSSASSTSTNQKTVEELEKLVKILISIEEIESNLNNPKRLKDKFLAAVRFGNEIVSKPAIGIVVTMAGTASAFASLNAEFNGLALMGATGASAVVSYAALRITPLGIGLGNVAGRIVFGNSVRAVTAVTKLSDDTKKIMIAGSIVIGSFSGCVYGGYETYKQLKDAGIELIKHPAKLQKTW